MKRYSANAIASMLNEIIFVLGLFFTFKSKNNLTLDIVIVLCSWYMFQNMVNEMVNDVQVEIRAETLINLIVSRSNILLIFFKRSIFILFKAFIILCFTIIFFNNDIIVNEIEIKNIIVFLILILILVYLVYYIFFSLCIIFERISTFTTFFSSVVIIFSNKIKILREIYNVLLNNSVDYEYIFLNFMILFLIVIIVLKYALKKINTKGF